MTAPATPAPVTAWLWGGGLLIASALFTMAGSVAVGGGSGIAAATIGWADRLTFAAALLLFAFGWRGRGSVVAGATGGVIALVVLAMWRPAVAALTSVVVYSLDTAEFLAILAYIDILVWIGAGIAAVVAIGRARVVPPPWNWAPAWGFAAVTAVGVIATASIGALSNQPGDLEVVGLLTAVGSLVTIFVPTLLGVLAIVLGARTDPRATVQVYPPSPGGTDLTPGTPSRG